MSLLICCTASIGSSFITVTITLSLVVELNNLTELAGIISTVISRSDNTSHFRQKFPLLAQDVVGQVDDSVGLLNAVPHLLSLSLGAHA